jgi:hypothetical protein
VSAEQALAHLVALEPMMLGHLREDRRQRPDPDRLVLGAIGDRGSSDGADRSAPW